MVKKESSQKKLDKVTSETTTLIQEQETLPTGSNIVEA